MRSGRPIAHLQRHTKNSIAELALPLSNRAPTDDHNYESFIMALLSRMKSSIWYNIIPFGPNDVSDMSTSMGQRWELVLPLLFNANYVLLKRSQLCINIIKWQNLRLLLEGDDMIQIVSFRPRGKKIAWYVCRGIPRFTSPSQQIKNVILATFAHCELHLPTRTGIVLKNKLEYISQLQQSKYMSINTVNGNDSSE